jgi:hypothetical protein
MTSYWTGKKRPDMSERFRGKKFSDATKEKQRQTKLKNPTRYWLGKKRPDIAKIQRGRKVSDITRERLSKSHLGITHKLSSEVRKKMSERQKGDKSPLWKGGVSKLSKRIRAGLDFRLWREAIFSRDDFTCQKCGERGGHLCPHHMDSFANNKEGRFDVDNGITLCESCHKEFHKEFGYKGSTWEKTEVFIEGVED